MARFQVAVSHEGSAALEPRCIRVPVLLGSRVQGALDVDNEFSIKYEAVKDGATLTFTGVMDAASVERTLNVERLRSGYAEELEVVTLGGSTFTVNLTSECD